MSSDAKTSTSPLRKQSLKFHFLVAFVIGALCLLPPTGHATNKEPSPIALVNGSLNVEDLTEREFRRLFLGTQDHWEEGSEVVLVLPPPGSDTMSWLCHELRVSEHLYWRGLMERALRGDIQKPLQARDMSHALELTAETTGAITPLGPGFNEAFPDELPGDIEDTGSVGLIWLGESP